jgi:hypothetical protein
MPSGDLGSGGGGGGGAGVIFVPRDLMLKDGDISPLPTAAPGRDPRQQRHRMARSMGSPLCVLEVLDETSSECAKSELR